jgi:hypothetical protein
MPTANAIELHVPAGNALETEYLDLAARPFAVFFCGISVCYFRTYIKGQEVRTSNDGSREIAHIRCGRPTQ